MAQSLGPENAGLRDVMREVADQWHRLAADAEAKERYNSNWPTTLPRPQMRTFRERD
jgi:hypothetical protein